MSEKFIVQNLPSRIEKKVENNFTKNSSKIDAYIGQYKRDGVEVFFSGFSKWKNSTDKLDTLSDFNKFNNLVNSLTDDLATSQKRVANDFVDDISANNGIMFKELESEIWQEDDIRARISKLDLYLLFDDKDAKIEQVKAQVKKNPYNDLQFLKDRLLKMQEEVQKIKKKNYAKRASEKKRPWNIVIALVLFKILSVFIEGFLPREDVSNVSYGFKGALEGFREVFSSLVKSAYMAFQMINVVYFILIFVGVLVLAGFGLKSLYKNYMKKIDDKYDAILSEDLTKYLNKEIGDIENYKTKIVDVFEEYLHEINTQVEEEYKEYIKYSINNIHIRKIEVSEM